MKNFKFPYARPNVTTEDIKEVTKALRSQFLAQGQINKNFEKTIEKQFFQ